MTTGESKTTAIKTQGRSLDGGSEDETVAAVENGVVVNASGYQDQLRRQYSLLGLAGIAVTVDNAWVALGSSIQISIRMTMPNHTVSISLVSST